MTNATESFGRRITHADANAYFLRYVDMKRKHGQQLKEHLKDDPDAQRFFCGRKDASPEGEDWAYIFDPASVARFMEAMKEMGADSIVIFQGIRNLEPGDPDGESDGRPTLLFFPARYSEGKEESPHFEIGLLGEEHPGTGGRTDTRTTDMMLPRMLSIEQIHKYY